MGEAMNLQEESVVNNLYKYVIHSYLHKGGQAPH